MCETHPWRDREGKSSKQIVLTFPWTEKARGNCKLGRLSHFLQSTMETVATTIWSAWDLHLCTAIILIEGGKSCFILINLFFWFGCMNLYLVLGAWICFLILMFILIVNGLTTAWPQSDLWPLSQPTPVWCLVLFWIVWFNHKCRGTFNLTMPFQKI